MLPQGVCRKEKGFHTGEKGEKLVHIQLSTFPQNVVESDKLYGLEKWEIDMNKNSRSYSYRALMLERISLMTSVISGVLFFSFSTRSMEWRTVV